MSINSITQINNWNSLLLFGSPELDLSDFLIKISWTFLENDYNVVLIDANHKIYPELLLSIKEETFLNNLILVKPSTLKAISQIAEELGFSTYSKNEKILFILSSLFIQIPYNYWKISEFDPLLISSLLTSFTKRKPTYKFIATVDTYSEDLDNLPYKNILLRLFDKIYKIKLEGNNITLIELNKNRWAPIPFWI